MQEINEPINTPLFWRIFYKCQQDVLKKYPAATFVEITNKATKMAMEEHNEYVQSHA